MFDKPKSTKKDLFGRTNRIVEGTVIKGEVFSIADFRLDGELIGNFKSEGKLVIGESGKVVGDVFCKNLDVEGNYQGKAHISELLTVKSKAKIKGEVLVGKLLVEPGADFTATCQMKGVVKNIESSIDGKSKSTEKAL